MCRRLGGDREARNGLLSNGQSNGQSSNRLTRHQQRQQQRQQQQQQQQQQQSALPEITPKDCKTWKKDAESERCNLCEIAFGPFRR
jgi:membrane protease subunit (stomatin/prohibitin family)